MDKMMQQRVSTYLLTTYKPSLVFFSVLNSILWVIFLALPGEWTSRNATRLMMLVGGDNVWTLLFGAAALAQIAVYRWRRTVQWAVQGANGYTAALNLTVLIASGLSIWPPPALYAGHICITLATVLLYATGDRRRGCRR